MVFLIIPVSRKLFKKWDWIWNTDTQLLDAGIPDSNLTTVLNACPRTLKKEKCWMWQDELTWFICTDCAFSHSSGKGTELAAWASTVKTPCVPGIAFTWPPHHLASTSPGLPSRPEWKLLVKWSSGSQEPFHSLCDLPFEVNDSHFK